MSDINFNNVAEFIFNVVLAALVSFVLPAAIWIGAARFGLPTPPWLLTTAKAFTLLGGAFLLVVMLGLGAIFSK